MLSFEEFSSKIMNGESRNRPGVGCGYILIKEKDEEVFLRRMGSGETKYIA